MGGALRGLSLALLLALVASGCSQVQCGAPTRATFTCDPLPAGSEGCAPEETAWGPAPEADPASRYPAGCQIRYPFCHTYYPDSVASCNCSRRPGGTFGWDCPL